MENHRGTRRPKQPTAITCDSCGESDFGIVKVEGVVSMECDKCKTRKVISPEELQTFTVHCPQCKTEHNLSDFLEESQ